MHEQHVSPDEDPTKLKPGAPAPAPGLRVVPQVLAV